MKKPRIAELKSRITFYTETKVQGANFKYTTTNVEDFTAWGKLEVKNSMGIRGYEFANNVDDTDKRATHTITMRSNNILPTHVIKTEGFTFELLAINPLQFGHDRWVQLEVQQMTDGTGSCS